MDKLVEGFINRRSISKDMELNYPLYCGILNLERCNENICSIFNEKNSVLAENAPYLVMRDMYERNYEYCCGVVSCFLLAQIQSTEALCRTAIEGSVNLHYVSLGDSMDHLIAYFKKYIDTERRQIQTWRDSIERSSHASDDKEVHFHSMAQKERALELYDSGLRESLSLIGIDYNSVDEKWPSIFDRFKAIGKEIEYRTVYAALCSQAHSDPEDLLNNLMCRITECAKGMDDAIWIENYNTSLYFMLIAIDFHIFSSAMFIAKHEISATEFMGYRKEVADSLEFVVEQGPKKIRELVEVSKNL